MRIGISNIAWDMSEDSQIASILIRNGLDSIDVAPGKYFPDPMVATASDIAAVKSWWAERGIEITGMQALMFGTSGLNVFGPATSQEQMLAHLRAVCRIGARLGAGRLVFGSPKNRDRTGLSDAEAVAVAVPFFRELGAIAEDHGVVVCLEPTPTVYGSNFMTDSAQTADVVRAVDMPSIRMQVDTGAITINAEDPDLAIREHADLVGHVHASEPQLVTLGAGRSDHAAAGAVLRECLGHHIVIVEMLPTGTGPQAEHVQRALHVALANYGDARVGTGA